MKYFLFLDLQNELAIPEPIDEEFIMDDFDTTFDTPEEFNSIFSVDKELIDPISDETEATSQRNTFSTTKSIAKKGILYIFTFLT